MRSAAATGERSGWLRRRDARAKLGGLVAVSLGVTVAGPTGLLAGAVTAGGAVAAAGLRFRAVAWQLRAVLPIVALGTLARAATVEGALWSLDGLVAGLVASGRFVVLVAFALAVSSTTPAADLALAIEWVLAPIPFVAATDWATMFGAAVRFFPLIGDEVATVRDAQRARLGDRRGVVSRLVGLLVASVASTLRRADALALAMRSRAYTGTRTSRRRLRFRAPDGAMLVGAATWSVAVAVL